MINYICDKCKQEVDNVALDLCTLELEPPEVHYCTEDKETMHLCRKCAKKFFKWLNEDVQENVPTADVVEVVRCKDCKKYNKDDCMMIHGKKMNRNIFSNDYCSYGERAEE